MSETQHTSEQSTKTGHLNHWSATATKAGTYEFKTAGTFVDRNIDFIVPAAETSKTDGTATATAGTTSVQGMEVVETNTGYSVTATGGSASTTTAQITAGVGFIDQAVTATSPAKSATGTSQTKYIKAATSSKTDGTVSITAGTATVSGMETTDENTGFSVTATGGQAEITASQVTVQTGYVGTAITASSPAKTATGESETKYIKAQTTGTQNSGTNVKTITPNTSTQYINVSTGYQNEAKKWTIQPISNAAAATYEGGTTQVSDETATRGDFHVKTVGYSGAANSQLLAPASFANSATAGTTYVDISTTSAAPILQSGKGIYINKGYVDNLYISLAKLTPDNASGAAAIKSGMLNSVSAYDNDGALITGDIESKSSTNVTHSGKTVTVPVGYYQSAVTHSIDDGSYTLSGGSGSANNSISELTTESISGATRLSSRFSSTAPSSGYYVAIQAPKKTVSVTPSATITSGYIAAGASATSVSDGTATVNASGKYYVSVPAGSISNNTSETGTSSGTIASGGRIKIGAGYYPNDVFYTAQDASSTGQASYTVQGQASGFTAAPSATAYYVTPSTSVTTSGYLSSSDSKTGDKVYIPTTTITGSLTASQSSSTYTAPTLVTAAPAGAYVTFVGSGTGNGTGMISSSVSGSSTKYLSIYEGSYSIS